MSNDINIHKVSDKQKRRAGHIGDTFVPVDQPQRTAELVASFMRGPTAPGSPSGNPG